MSDEREYSILILKYGAPDANLRSYDPSSFADKKLPSGFVSKEDGLYYEGTFVPGETRSGVFIEVNKQLATLLGLDR